MNIIDFIINWKRLRKYGGKAISEGRNLIIPSSLPTGRQASFPPSSSKGGLRWASVFRVAYRETFDIQILMN
jgi:hypothetical protein